MTEIEIPYLNTLSSQLLFICAFLGGFSATLLGTLITAELEGKVMFSIIIASAVSAMGFILSVLCMTGILLITTEGYPLEVNKGELNSLRLVGAFTMILGLLGLLVVIGISGWLKDKKLGYTTSAIAILGFILMLYIS